MSYRRVMGVFVKFLLHLDSFVDGSCVTQNLSDDIYVPGRKVYRFFLYFCVFWLLLQYELILNFPKICNHPRSLFPWRLFSVQSRSTWTGTWRIIPVRIRGDRITPFISAMKGKWPFGYGEQHNPT